MLRQTRLASGREPASSRWFALGVLCAGMLMVILDGSIVTVALPALQQDLGFTAAGLAWAVNAYVIAFGGLLLLAGRLGDVLGMRRMYVVGLAVFTVASLLCGMSGSAVMLIGARFLQGAGAAMASAVSLGMIVSLFPRGRERATALGAFAFVAAAGASVGQVLGGVLTQALSWHWIFFINLPLGAAAVLLALRVLPADPARSGRRGTGVDALGAVLATGGLMLLVYTVVETETRGWTSGHTLGSGALALALLAAFVLRQTRAAQPLLPLRLLRSRNVWGANAVQLLTVGAMFGFQVLIALYLQKVRGYGPAETGSAMLPAAVLIGAVSLGASARLIGRFGERAMLLCGLTLLTAGMLWLTRLPAHGDYATDVLPMLLAASGFGVVQPALTSLAMSDAGPSDSGLASGVFNTTQQLGVALGVAVLNTIAAARTSTALQGGAGEAAALVDGFRTAFGVGAGLLVTAAVLTAVALTRPRTATDKQPSTAAPARPRPHADAHAD